ncbi:MAG: hypothetical protein ABIJ40_13975 [Bacteroidota bacterium]
MKKLSLTSYLFCFFKIVTSNAQEWININPTFDPVGLAGRLTADC